MATKKKSVKQAKPQSIDEYLARVPAESRAALEKLRRTIKSIVPEALETISYEIPTFQLNGRMLVSFAAFSAHCSFFPGAGPLEAHRDELESFPTSKGTIRFTPDRPLSATLIKKLVETRIKLDRARTKL
ncbi:MAG TPA: DUF1801 domain-containing protein [Pyrinomonadaceae bacterium]|nr:DUF1801 domain-containing protein [Pyrinomonadaceae bacterium]